MPEATEERKDERLVLLCSKSELKRFEAFRKAQKIPTKSDLMRHLIFSPIEQWETRDSEPVHA